LHVGLNLYHLNDRSGGTGTYARELIPAMLESEPQLHLTCFVTAQSPERLTAQDFDGRVAWVTLAGKVVDGPPWNAVTSVVAQWGLEPLLARRRRIDLVHGLANVAPIAGVPTVVTLLDLIWMHHPGTMSARDALGMRVLGLTSARRADRVIALSEAGRDDILRTVGIAADRIDVTPLGVRERPPGVVTPEAELRARLDLGNGPIVLCVAQKRAHKNLTALVRAVARLEDASVRLVLPGEPTRYEEELRALAAELGVADRVRLPSWVSGEDFEGLFATAGCFVLPSLMEGFGLPVAEAMQRGVPVACSNVSSLPEVVGDAALLFDPYDVAAIVEVIQRLLGDRALAGDLARRGRERVRELTWERTAQLTLETYRRALLRTSAPNRKV
jgi:glycosyltransferase involved in cell wall biosynthesis